MDALKKGYKIVRPLINRIRTEQGIVNKTLEMEWGDATLDSSDLWMEIQKLKLLWM